MAEELWEKTDGRIAVFTGSFDPVTIGHVDIIARAAKDYDRLIVCTLVNDEKTPRLALVDRLKLLNIVAKRYPNVSAAMYSGMTVDFCRSVGAVAIVRGVRGAQDMEYEQAMADYNMRESGIPTVFYTANPDYADIASSKLRPRMSRKQLAKILPPEILDEYIKLQF